MQDLSFGADGSLIEVDEKQEAPVYEVKQNKNVEQTFGVTLKKAKNRTSVKTTPPAVKNPPSTNISSDHSIRRKAPPPPPQNRRQPTSQTTASTPKTTGFDFLDNW